MKLSYFFIIFVFLFILLNLFLVSLIYQFVTVAPSFSISLSYDYTFPHVNTKYSAILPGSMVVAVNSYSPFFTLGTNPPTFNFTYGLAYLFLSLAVALTITGVVLLTLQEKKYILYSISSFFGGIVFFALSILFYSPAYYGNILCHTQNLFGEEAYICHKYISYNGTDVTLLRIYDNSTEVVPVQDVSGKIVYVIPPPIGTLVFLYKESVNFMYKLYLIVTQGNIPLSFEIKYICVDNCS